MPAVILNNVYACAYLFALGDNEKETKWRSFLIGPLNCTQLHSKPGADAKQ